MIRRYVAVAYVWTVGSFLSWEPRELRAYRTRERALRAARAWCDAHPVVTTAECYQRDFARGSGAEVQDARRGMRTLDVLDPLVRIVPSAADVGYW